ncbi:MAG: cytochrome c [Proteobacteria bacterium]|jgi:hypothetical protein|nr:cytochrome c [Pseudomonadota bacterium]
MKLGWMFALVVLGGAGRSLPATAQTSQHTMPDAAEMTASDARQLVRFPEPMRVHTIANMRDHLLALQQIDVSLSKGDFDAAAKIAEDRLGMSSLALHDAAHLAPYMPKGMQDIGTAMHHAASRFAVDAQNASVSNDVRPALAALGAVMEQCVACHATYRLK